MKMKNVYAGMEVTVFGRPAVVASMMLNGCFVEFDDGSGQYVAYDKLKEKEK